MKLELVPTDRIKRNADSTCWHDGWKAVSEHLDDDGYVVFEDVDNVAYAVYHKLKYGGALVGMLKHVGKALDLDPSDEFDAKLLEVFRKEAMDESFPPYHPGVLGTIDVGEGYIGHPKRVERWDKPSSPLLSVRCAFGRIIAGVTGDAGIYDELSIDLLTDDNKLMQLAIVGVTEAMDESESPTMHAYVWNGTDEEAKWEHDIEVSDKSYWY